jgi:hypothetical protein
VSSGAYDKGKGPPGAGPDPAGNSVLPSPAPIVMMPVAAVATVDDTAGQGGEDQGAEDDFQNAHVMYLPIGES